MEIDVEIDKEVFLPCYRHLIGSTSDINFLWGGRDSGKSHFIAQELVRDCLSSDYFRCILIKKTYESIKDAQFQTIKDVVYAWGLESLFNFKESPLEIRCINGNRFIARGCDKPEKLKSISNPSHAWYEEGNQLSSTDYITASTTLRSSEGRVKEWFSFNPECTGDFTEFWLYKDYFIDIPYNISCTRNKTIQVKDEAITITYSSTHTTYRDNPFCTSDRVAKIEGLQLINPYYYSVYSLGHWGKKEIKRPYVQNFKRDKHISELAIFNPNLPVIFSLDFNVEPFVCECAHIWTDNQGKLHFHTFDEVVIEKNGDVPEMCDRLLNQFGMRTMANALFTGDAMQAKREITQRDNIDAWRIINARFHLGNRLMVPKANPIVKENRHLMNALYAFHPDLLINPKCKKLIYDLQFVEADEEGNIIKKSRNNEAQRSDALDAHRYMCNSFLYDFIDKYKK